MYANVVSKCFSAEPTRRVLFEAANAKCHLHTFFFSIVVLLLVAVVVVFKFKGYHLFVYMVRETFKVVSKVRKIQV